MTLLKLPIGNNSETSQPPGISSTEIVLGDPKAPEGLGGYLTELSQSCLTTAGQAPSSMQLAFSELRLLVLLTAVHPNWPHPLLGVKVCSELL